MSINLYNGDCLEVMKTLDDKSIDCFICDLPYGCFKNEVKGFLETSTQVYKKQNWDSVINLEEFWTQIARLSKSKDTPILMFCSMRFFIQLAKSNEKHYQYSYIWKKPRGTNFMDANRKPLQDFEVIAVFAKQRPYFLRKEGKCATTTLEFPIPSNKKHPTEKPIDLYKWLIERYCPEGGTILDPTAGSCNSCFAAWELDRHAIGIEKDNEFYKNACKRIDTLME